MFCVCFSHFTIFWENAIYICFFFVYFGGINAQKQCTLYARYAQLLDQILHANRKAREKKKTTANKILMCVCVWLKWNQWSVTSIEFSLKKKKTWIKNCCAHLTYGPWCIFSFEIVCTTKESSSSYCPFDTGTNPMKCRLSQWFL